MRSDHTGRTNLLENSEGRKFSSQMATVYRDDIKCLDETLQPHLADLGSLLLAQAETFFAPPGLCKSNTAVTIFDWDDTILCTSLLSSLDFPAEMPVNIKPLMEEMEDRAYRLLSEALALGPVYIVTNAVKGWVEDSAAQHLPGLMPLLSQLTVVSAREQFGYQNPDPGSWKKCAFLNLLKDIDFHQFQDIIVIGDSLYEMEAGLLMRNLFGLAYHLRIKLIKLKENPSAEVLSQQMDFLLGCFNLVALLPYDFYLRLEDGCDLEFQL